MLADQVNPVLQVVIPAAAGLVSGAVASLIAPWAHWSVEKRRETRAFKRNQIIAWRYWLNNYWGSSNFKQSSTYSEMRPYLSAHVRSALEGGPQLVREGRGGNDLQTLILDDLARLERDWGLM